MTDEGAEEGESLSAKGGETAVSLVSGKLSLTQCNLTLLAQVLYLYYITVLSIACLNKPQSHTKI